MLASLCAGASMAQPAGSRGWRSGRITSSKINAIASHGYRHSIAKAGTLPDAVGQVVRVYRFFQAEGQRLFVAARQAAIGDEAFAHHATLLHRAKQVLVVAEGAEPADVDQPVLLGRHDGYVCAVHHFAHDLVDAVLRVFGLALLDEPGVLREAGGVDHYRNACLIRAAPARLGLRPPRSLRRCRACRRDAGWMGVRRLRRLQCIGNAGARQACKPLCAPSAKRSVGNGGSAGCRPGSRTWSKRRLNLVAPNGSGCSTLSVIASGTEVVEGDERKEQGDGHCSPPLHGGRRSHALQRLGSGWGRCSGGRVGFHIQLSCSTCGARIGLARLQRRAGQGRCGEARG